MLNVGGNIDLENGSFIKIDRHLGAVLQPPKGTGTGSNVLSLNLPATTTQVAQAPQTAVSGYIQGNVNIGATSSFIVGGEIFYPLYIIGDVTGTNLITIGSVKSTAEPDPLLIQGTPNPSPSFPAITSPSSTTFTVGTPGTFTVTTTGFTPPATLSETGTLPSGVTFVDNGDGTATAQRHPGDRHRRHLPADDHRHQQRELRHPDLHADRHRRRRRRADGHGPEPEQRPGGRWHSGDDHRHQPLRRHGGTLRPDSGDDHAYGATTTRSRSRARRAPP